MDIITGNVGWIEVICGPMFSGKSEELIRRLRRAMIARKRVEVFKPAIDNRYSDNEIVSHGDLRMNSQVFPTPRKSPNASTGEAKWWASTKPISWGLNWWTSHSVWLTAANR